MIHPALLFERQVFSEEITPKSKGSFFVSSARLERKGAKLALSITRDKKTLMKD
jgi:hypothetical protein